MPVRGGSGLPGKRMLPVHPKLQGYCQPEGRISIARPAALPSRSESRQLVLLALALPSAAIGEQVGMWESSWNSPCCDEAQMKDLQGTEGTRRGTSNPAGIAHSFGGSKLGERRLVPRWICPPSQRRG